MQKLLRLPYGAGETDDENDLLEAGLHVCLININDETEPDEYQRLYCTSKENVETAVKTFEERLPRRATSKPVGKILPDPGSAVSDSSVPCEGVAMCYVLAWDNQDGNVEFQAVIPVEDAEDMLECDRYEGNLNFPVGINEMRDRRICEICGIRRSCVLCSECGRHACHYCTYDILQFGLLCAISGDHSVVIKNDQNKKMFRIGQAGVEKDCSNRSATLKVLENGSTDFEEDGHGPLTLRVTPNACNRRSRDELFNDCGLKNCMLLQLLQMDNVAERWMDKSFKQNNGKIQCGGAGEQAISNAYESSSNQLVMQFCILETVVVSSKQLWENVICSENARFIYHDYIYGNFEVSLQCYFSPVDERNQQDNVMFDLYNMHVSIRNGIQEIIIIAHMSKFDTLDTMIVSSTHLVVSHNVRRADFRDLSDLDDRIVAAVMSKLSALDTTNISMNQLLGSLYSAPGGSGQFLSSTSSFNTGEMAQGSYGGRRSPIASKGSSLGWSNMRGNSASSRGVLLAQSNVVDRETGGRVSN